MDRTEDKKMAKALRKEGKSLSEIAEVIDAYKSQVSVWVRDVELSEEAEKRLDRKNPASKNYDGKRVSNSQDARLKGAHANKLKWEKKRKLYQKQGYKEANGDSLHIAGCMLYWAEGHKDKTSLRFTNSDPYMMKMFLNFLYQYYNIDKQDISLGFHTSAYCDLTDEEIQKYWMQELGFQENHCHAVSKDNRKPKKKKNKKDYYGTCRIQINDVQLVQRIFGAIKKYAGIEDQELWLNGYQ